MDRFNIDEMFRSIQGEGFNFGKDFFFVRFSQCNLDCPWCDQPTESKYHLTEEELIEKIKESGSSSVLFTGGEPTLQLTEKLVYKVKSLGYFTAIETNGTNPIPKGIDYITVSPKEGAKTVVTNANEVRVATQNRDSEFYLNIQREIKADRYYLSPIYIEEKKQFDFETLAKVYDELRNHNFLISVQLHKLMGVR